MGRFKKNMGTTLVQPRQNGADITKLTVGMQNFVQEMLAHDSMNPTAAAREAGYSRPSQAANKLMKNKAIQRALGKAQRERNERCQLKADDVLKFIMEALFFDPIEYDLEPAPGGGWLVEDITALPIVARQLIKDVAKVEIVDSDGTVEVWDVIKNFIPKEIALALAARHALVEKSEVTNRLSMDWDQLFSKRNGEGIIDPVEQAILDVESEKVEE